ncbi:TetR/AcrR family transcriptional regulator [soil metagenome]
MTTRVRSRKGEGDRLREEILDAAQDLLIETGAEEEVSIRSVADAVGVTPPSIYRHFRDKSHLIFEVCVRCFDRLAEVIAAAEVPGDPFATLDQQARAYIRFGVEHPEHYRIMFMGRVDLTPEEYAEELLLDSSAFGMLCKTIEGCFASGRLRPRLEAAGVLEVALLSFATVHGLTSLLVAKPGMPWPPREEMIELVLDTHIRSLLTDGAGARPTVGKGLPTGRGSLPRS